MRNGTRKSGARGVVRFVPLVVACLAGASMLGIGIMAAGAQVPGKRALILGSSVVGGSSGDEAQAATHERTTVELASMPRMGEERDELCRIRIDRHRRPQLWVVASSRDDEHEPLPTR